MNKKRGLVFAGVFLLACGISSAKPRFPFPSTPDQVGQNDRDLDDQILQIPVITSVTLPSGSTQYIQNINSLQAGSTAYPAYAHIGSSITIPVAAFNSGSPALPSMTFDGDPDTGIFRLAANEVGIACNGQTQADISANGIDLNVAAAANLKIRSASTEVLGADQQNFYVTSTGGAQFRVLASGSSAVYVQTQSNHQLILDTNNGVSAVVISTNAEVTQPNQPSFLAVDGTGATDVTGDGTAYTELWPTEIYDQSSDFASNTFTAPITGRYYLSAFVRVRNIAVTHTGSRILSIVTSNRSYRWFLEQTIATNENTFQLAVVADMDAGDTATVTIAVNGGAKTVDISNGDNYFSGSLFN